jgi:hypothetical protein
MVFLTLSLKHRNKIIMSNTTPDWSKKEFLGYLFLYCAHADYVEKEEERSFILSKIDEPVLQKMRPEFEADKDYDRVQKIVTTAEKHYPSDSGKEGLVDEIKNFFLSDGEFDMLERDIFRGLKRLIGS